MHPNQLLSLADSKSYAPMPKTHDKIQRGMKKAKPAGRWHNSSREYRRGVHPKSKGWCKHAYAGMSKSIYLLSVSGEDHRGCPNEEAFYWLNHCCHCDIRFKMASAVRFEWMRWYDWVGQMFIELGTHHRYDFASEWRDMDWRRMCKCYGFFMGVRFWLFDELHWCVNV